MAGRGGGWPTRQDGGTSGPYRPGEYKRGAAKAGRGAVKVVKATGKVVKWMATGKTK